MADRAACILAEDRWPPRMIASACLGLVRPGAERPMPNSWSVATARITISAARAPPTTPSSSRRVFGDGAWATIDSQTNIETKSIKVSCRN